MIKQYINKDNIHLWIITGLVLLMLLMGVYTILTLDPSRFLCPEYEVLPCFNWMKWLKSMVKPLIGLAGLAIIIPHVEKLRLYLPARQFSDIAGLQYSIA